MKLGYLYLFTAKITAIGKMMAMKKCGNAAAGAENSLKINLLRSLGCVAISLIICLFSGFDNLSHLGLVFSVLSGVANALLLFSWVLCAQRCSLCSVEIFCMIGGVVLPMLLTPLMFSGESIGILGWVGAILLIPAAFAFFPKDGSRKGFSFSSLPLLLLAGLSNAGCVISQKLFTAYKGGSISDFNLITFLSCSVVLAIFLCILLLLSKGKKIKEKTAKLHKKQLFVYIFIAVAMLYASQYFGTLASEKMESRIFFPLSYAIAMPLTLITDILFFKEKLTLRSLAGLLLVISAVLFINFNI